MIRLEKLQYGFPQKDLYTDATFSLEDGQHCAFIGASGNGKSTLVNIIMDPERYMYDGKLDIEPNCRIHYVKQFSQLEQTYETTVFDYIAAPFVKVENEIADLCMQMENAEDLDAVLDQYQQALDAFEALDGDNYVTNIDKKLNQAGLMKHRDLKVSDLSGGEFKLIQVIREMLNKPEVIIMDEPDVFLDFENIAALKDLINSHKGILLVITHSRYLLNHCFNKIIHLENGEIQEFDGTYVDYNFTLLQRKIELQEQAQAEAEEIEKNNVLIDKLRFIATYNSDASRGKALKARVKFQERLEARRIKQPFVEIKQPDLVLKTDIAIADETAIALTVKDFTISFDELLLENVNFEIGVRDKVAIIGSNGTGKTTLIREIVKNENPAITRHQDLKITYLSQHQGESLNEANTLIEEFYDAGFNSLSKIKSYLMDFNFYGEILDQKIGSLSGGEKNILQLAKITANNANLLLLDEPTSHLDTYAQLALEEAITNYNGALIMISHDYYTIANCMDYVLVIEDKTIRKMSIRKFRKMVYANHFDHDYLVFEEKKKAIETEIAMALSCTDFERAKKMSLELETLLNLG